MKQINRFVKSILPALFLLFGFHLLSQVNNGLVAHFSFDKDTCKVEDEAGDPTILTFVNGDPVCDCGVQGQALRFDGTDDFFFIFGNRIEETFTTIDFSISFYFRVTNFTSQSMAIISKRNECDTSNYFAIRFNPATTTINVDLNESNTISGTISEALPFSCWYHVVAVRRGKKTFLYINGELVAEATSTSNKRVNIFNQSELTVGMSECFIDNNFQGFLDELRIYNRALDANEVKELFFAPDQIATGQSLTGINDTTIFVGGSVQTLLNRTCMDQFIWSPTTGIASGQETTSEPLLSPLETTTYSLKLGDAFCETTDSLRIIVVDPDSLDCVQVFLPNAFTPNNDGLNETYGISNPLVISELISFEIFNRWGNRVFATTNPLERWDCSYKGTDINSGVFLYKVRFR